MCLNIDITHMEVAADWINSILQGGSLTPPATWMHPRRRSRPQNTCRGTWTICRDIIQTVLGKISIPADRLSSNEKIEIVKELNEQGVFLLKGGVSKVAAALSISEPTVYRYLQKLK